MTVSETRLREFADELRKYWSFDDGQMHTHSWHDRENFIERKLPALLTAALSDQVEPDSLATLRQAIIDHTHGDLFWIGEILLNELEKETGFKGSPASTAGEVK